MNTTTHLQTHQRQQLRGFMVVWMAVTLLVGMATFVAIYLGTGNLNSSDGNSDDGVVAIAPNDDNAENADASVDTDTEDTKAVVEGEDPVDTQDTAVDTETETTNTTQDTTSETTDEDVEAVDPGTTNPAAESSANGTTDNNPPAEPAQQDATPTFAPTIPATSETEFDLGTQVMIPVDNSADRLAGYMDAAANQLRLNWVKLQIRWEFIEPEEGVYDWSQLDNFFQFVPEKNLKVLASVVTAPEWARQPGADLTKHGPPADNQKFADFVGQLILRYPGSIHAIEVWNEMNIDREWASINGINAAEYVSMLQVVANTIRFLDPNILVVSGAPSPTGVNAAGVITDDFRYTDELIAAGVLDVIDCFGAHHNGYNIGPNVPADNVPNDPTATFRGPFDNPDHSWSFYTTLNTYATKISAAGSDVPLCVTEFGWATTADLGGYPQGFEFANDNTVEEQGQFLVEAIQLMEEWGFVRLAFIWNLNFGPETSFEATNDNVPYSLIRPNYVPSPAWLPISEMDFRGRALERATAE